MIVKRQLAAIRRADHDLDPAGDDHDQGVTRITCGEHHLTAPEGPPPGSCGDGLQVLGRNRAEQIGLAEDVGDFSRHQLAPGALALLATARSTVLTSYGVRWGCLLSSLATSPAT